MPVRCKNRWQEREHAPPAKPTRRLGCATARLLPASWEVQSEPLFRHRFLSIALLGVVISGLSLAPVEGTEGQGHEEIDDDFTVGRGAPPGAGGAELRLARPRRSGGGWGLPRHRTRVGGASLP